MFCFGVQYNGCVWKGGRLKLEKAKEHYLARLRREWAEDAELQKGTPDDIVSDAAGSLEKSKSLTQEKIQLRIFFPGLKKVISNCMVFLSGAPFGLSKSWNTQNWVSLN